MSVPFPSCISIQNRIILLLVISQTLLCRTTMASIYETLPEDIKEVDVIIAGGNSIASRVFPVARTKANEHL